MTITSARVAAGVPTGGQFAAAGHAEPETTLVPTEAEPAGRLDIGEVVFDADRLERNGWKMVRRVNDASGDSAVAEFARRDRRIRVTADLVRGSVRIVDADDNAELADTQFAGEDDDERYFPFTATDVIADELDRVPGKLAADPAAERSAAFKRVHDADDVMRAARKVALACSSNAAGEGIAAQCPQATTMRVVRDAKDPGRIGGVQLLDADGAVLATSDDNAPGNPAAMAHYALVKHVRLDDETWRNAVEINDSGWGVADGDLVRVEKLRTVREWDL